MKIFINNLNLNILSNLDKLFKDYLFNTENSIELYTDEGIFNIYDKNIYKLFPNDKPIVTYKNYYIDFTLIVDKSCFIKEKVNSINGKTYLSFETVKNYYRINNKCNVYLVIKYCYENNKLIPNDIYFEIDNDDIEINDIYIKKEIIEFLSLLN
jgi:hypothetical protein